MDKNNFDVCIIGGGIAGLTAANNALKENLTVALFEKDNIGGKAFNGGDFYLRNIFKALRDISEKDNTVLNKMFKETQEEKNELLNHYFPFLVNNKKLTIFKHNATIINPNLVIANKIKCNCKNIIIATGSKHNVVAIEGINEALEKGVALYSTRLNEIKPDTKKIAIIGGGRVAFELAMMLSEFEIETHVFARSDVLNHLDAEVKEHYIDLVKNDCLHLHTNTRFNKIEEKTLFYNDTSDNFDYYILASGFYFDNKILSNLNINHNSKGITVNEFMQTSIKNIYAIGDVNIHDKFSRVAINEAIVATSHIKGFRTPITSKFLYTILGKHEYSYIGQSEEELIKQNISYSKLIIHEKDLPNHRDQISFVKVLINKTTREILGIFVIAKDAFAVINFLNLLLEETIEDKINSRLPLFTNVYYISKKIEEKLEEMDYNIINNYYEPFYQLKVNKDRKIVGAESLARFKENEKFLFPLPFIKNFESNGLIVDFDLKTILYAAKFISELNELKLIDDDFQLSVNLSPLTIEILNYREIINILNKYNVNYKQILFEITERKTTEDETFKQKLLKFNSYGLNLSMDDFSVGNSSLHLFYDVDFSEVKLDMALLPKNEDDLVKYNIYKYLVNLMKTEKSLLTSEGIEDEFHFNFTKILGVDCFQGYYFSRPIPKDAFIKLLEEAKKNNFII